MGLSLANGICQRQSYTSYRKDYLFVCGLVGLGKRLDQMLCNAFSSTLIGVIISRRTPRYKLPISYIIFILALSFTSSFPGV